MNYLTNIFSNLPAAVMIDLRNRFHLEQFIETGTCSGRTSLMASLAFPHVKTVEINPDRFQEAELLLQAMPGVVREHGDSVAWLASQGWSQAPPTFFYLDAHTDDSNEPLHKELEAIGGLYGKHAIVIDDFNADPYYDLVRNWPNCYVFEADHDPDRNHQLSVLTYQSVDWAATVLPGKYRTK